LNASLLIAAWLAVPLVCGTAIAALRRRHHLPATREPCFQCGYDLTDIWHDAPCCPECGHSKSGHVVIRASSSRLIELADAFALALVWWLMISLTIAGIAWVFAAGAKIGEWQIPR
jgi:hypothetical protein